MKESYNNLKVKNGYILGKRINLNRNNIFLSSQKETTATFKIIDSENTNVNEYKKDDIVIAIVDEIYYINENLAFFHNSKVLGIYKEGKVGKE